MMYFVSAIILLLGVTPWSASGFVAVQPRRHWAASLTFRPAVTTFLSTADSESRGVWVNLFIDGDDLKEFEINPVPLNVNRLKKAVHQEMQPDLNHCSTASLQVYAPNTNPEDSSATPLSPKLKLLPQFEEQISNYESFIIRAQKKLQQQNMESRNKLQSEVKEFNLQHLLNIKKDESWVDCGHGFVFMGRELFVNAILESFQTLFNPPPRASKSGRAFVYSSVSGTGKTVSMLQLKAKLPTVFEGVPVVVSYLGFNTELRLNNKEIYHIERFPSSGPNDVLSRRLAGATVISMNNPNSITDLPTYESVYGGYEIPSDSESFEILLAHTDRKPIFIVAGVDEVQLLNQENLGTSVPLGRLFLRILRQWQYDLYKFGIRLIPLGTGIAIDWSADPSSGNNFPLHGDGVSLISKPDFSYACGNNS